MATLLYRLGLGAARRPLLVILAWVLALALAVGGFLAFGGTLSSTVTIPGTPTAQVTDRLKDCLLYTSPSPRDATLSRMPSSA